MIESPSAERRTPPNEADAYRALHLLPNAPRPLVTAVYQRLARDLSAAVRDDPDRRSRLDALDAAYGTALAAGEPAPTNGHDASSRLELRPWELLHVTQDAPPEVIAIAYEFWRRGLELPEPAADERPPEDGCNYSSADERLAALGGQHPNTRPGRERCAAPGEGRLVVEDGPWADERSFPVGDEPLRIGSDPTFDVAIAAQSGRKNRVEARLWSLRGRFMLHVVDAAASAVRLNGQPVVWAVLDHGDRLEIAGERFRFERHDGDR